MRISFILSVVFLSMPGSAEAMQPATQQAKTALESWVPKSVSLDEKGTLTVVLPQRRITNEIYKASLLIGFCAVGVAGYNYEYVDVKEVVILNQFKAQGYVFEGGASACKELNALKGKSQEIKLLGQTHLF